MPRKTKKAILVEEPETPTDDTTTTPVETPVEAQSATSPEGIFDQDGELVVDVFETKADFVVLAAIAGVQIKDLDISLEKEMMIIKGNRCDPNSHPDKKYFYQECYWGPFSRKVVLPENIDIDGADAQIDKGILTIKIPKNEPTNGNGKIGIKVS
ncbi:MAG: Hsp20/alpha crystallin family protein [Candidatus Staskawiczbacteria bacterium]|jgi:HSP20 family protein